MVSLGDSCVVLICCAVAVEHVQHGKRGGCHLSVPLSVFHEIDLSIQSRTVYLLLELHRVPFGLGPRLNSPEFENFHFSECSTKPRAQPLQVILQYSPKQPV